MSTKPPFRVEFNAEFIRSLRNGQEVWSLKWKDLEAIGYRTTSSGPWFDDHFLVFRKKGEDRPYEVSLEWTGAMELSEHVNRLGDTKMTERGTLMNCVQDDSITIWPSSRAGKPII
jgi:hypothetical protein